MSHGKNWAGIAVQPFIVWIAWGVWKVWKAYGARSFLQTGICKEYDRYSLFRGYQILTHLKPFNDWTGNIIWQAIISYKSIVEKCENFQKKRRKREKRKKKKKKGLKILKLHPHNNCGFKFLWLVLLIFGWIF